MKASSLAIVVSAVLQAGPAQAAVVEGLALVPSWAAPAPAAGPQVKPGADLFLWRNLGTVLDTAQSPLGPEPGPSGQAAADDAFGVDLFGVGRGTSDKADPARTP